MKSHPKTGRFAPEIPPHLGGTITKKRTEEKYVQHGLTIRVSVQVTTNTHTHTHSRVCSTYHMAHDEEPEALPKKKSIAGGLGTAIPPAANPPSRDLGS